jgi:hypothetical protein
MSIVPLTYLRKRYKVVPFTNHKLKTCINIADSDTFLTSRGTDAELVLDHNSIYLSQTPVVIKIMANNLYGRTEVRAQNFFKQNPHRNIVRGICNFIISDCPVKWNTDMSDLEHSHCWMCSIDRYIVISQDYIDGGDLFSNYKYLNYVQWKSILLQNLFATFELFDKYKFTYRYNWKPSNILLYKTLDSEVVYNAFDKEWIIKNTYGLSPVFTDFSKSSFYYKDYCHLAREICYCINMYGKYCKNTIVENYCTNFAIIIEKVTQLNTIIEMVNTFIKTLDKY